MGWESRRRGGQYYTRSIRAGRRVRREYLGAGLGGELASRLDEQGREARRREREEAEGRLDALRSRLTADLPALDDLDRLAREVVRAAFLAAGFRLHHGCWRKKRVRKESKQRQAG